MALAELRGRGTGAAVRRNLPEALALIALLSLFARSTRYPELLAVGDAAVRVQDILILVTAVVCGRPLLKAYRPGVLTVLCAGLIALLVVSAVRSPVTSSALVSVAKLAEFVLIGVIIAGTLRSPPARASRVTAVLVAGVVINAIYGAGDLGTDLSARSGALMGTETAATAAAAVVIWCVARLTRGAAGRERWLAIVGVVAGVGLLLMTKSVLGLGLAPALAVLLAAIGRRWVIGAVALTAILALAIGVARSSDVRALVEGEQPVPAAIEDGRSAPIPDDEGLQGGSFVHRIALGYAGLHTAEREPWLGTGWLSTPRADTVEAGPYDRLMFERFPNISPNLLLTTYPTHFHNAYLQLAAEAGIFALLLGVALLAVAISRCARRCGPGSDVWDWAGLAWLTLMVCHYAGNVLFGASINAAILGFGLAIAGTAGTPPATRRHMAVVATTVAVLLGLQVLVLEVGGGGTPTSTARVVTAESGREVDVGRGSAADGLTVSNGLSMLHTDSPVITVSALDAAGDEIGAQLPVFVGGEPVRAASAEMLQHKSTITSLRALTASGVPVTLSVVRGAPGVYVGVGGGRKAVGIPLAADAPVLSDGRRIPDGDRRRTTWPIDGLSPVTALAPDDIFVTMTPDVTARATRTERGLQLAPIGDHPTVFIGLSPAGGAPLLDGQSAPPRAAEVLTAGVSRRAAALDAACLPSEAVPDPCP